MELHLEHPGNYPHVHHVEERAVIVVHGEQVHRLTASFFLGEDHIAENWPVTAAERLEPAQIEPILALQPDVVILGTGNRQVFPPARVMATFLRHGIGIEPMDNAAAARTHTILTGEERRVVAAFILP